MWKQKNFSYTPPAAADKSDVMLIHTESDSTYILDFINDKHLGP